MAEEDTAVQSLQQNEEPTHLTASAALDELDKTWYNPLKPQWMDAISDFAGQELFVLEGDALLTYVLDNSLLKLGKKDEIESFSLLHARWLMEKTVKNLKDRDCTFHLVFFEANYHSTSATGQDDTVTTARALARSILARQAKAIEGLEVMTFESLDDEDWLSYFKRKRPMFILSNDGGLAIPGAGELQVARVLVQRAFLFAAVQRRIPIVLLQPAEFKDGKLMSYVLGNKFRRHTLEGPLDDAITAAQIALEDAFPTTPDVFTAPGSSTGISVVSHAIPTLLSSGLPEGLDKDVTSALLYVYAAHAILLPHLPLVSRAQLLPKIEPKLEDYLRKLLPTLYKALTSSVDALDENDTACDLDLDGRIFTLLLYSVLSSSSDEPLIELLGPDLASALAETWTSISLSPPDISTLRSTFTAPTAAASPSSSASSDTSTLLPFDNEVFSPLLPKTVSISDAKTKSSLPSQLGDTTSFVDDRVFEGPKALLPTHLGGAKPVELDARARKKKFRQEQRYMALMQKSAASLTGAMGAQLRAQMIPAVGKASRNTGPVKEKAAHAGQSGSGGGKKVMTSKEKLLAANAAKKQGEALDANKDWWNEKLAALKSAPLPGQITLINNYLKNKRSSDRWLGTEIALKRIDVELRSWIADENASKKPVADAYRTRIAVRAAELLRSKVRGEKDINEKQGKALVGTLDAMGLGCLVPAGIVFGESKDEKEVNGKGDAKGAKKEKEKKLKPGQGKKETKEKETKSSNGKSDEKEEKVKLSFSFVSLTKSGKALYDFMTLDGEDPLEFQLRCMGEFFVRELDSRPDPRVNFEPDAWQRDVLDKIDNDESMLIVAPTSSGKTFISFAAMEKVLRESDDGVVVYVAPSKALVNQVAAEVFARFSKDVPGTNMWAIHTLDYRINNPQNCQILVTVPHVLSLMLLNPALAKVWAPRLKRVILDEIHSISAEEGGAIWEQVLLMNPAPIIGLSATVGAPERFSDWLASVEKNRGRKYTLVEHHHRFNALRKFAYAPKFPLKKVGPLTEHNRTADVFKHIHPISALALGDPNLPDDLSLEPADTLTLWQAMAASGEVDPKLAPSTYFAATPAIAIRDVIKYEKELKSVFVSWMQAPGSEEPTSPYRRVVQHLEAPLRLATAEPELAIEEGGSNAFYGLFLPLLADLNSQGSLPAILFNYDRTGCEKIAERLLNDLEEAESRWKTKSPEWKRRVAKAAEAEKMARVKAKAAESASKAKKDEDGDRGNDLDDSQSPTFDPDAPAEEFSFVGKGISHVDFMREVNDLAWLKLPTWLINALRRGVGVHHAGLNRRYRVLVENLFRRGVLRVVISTGTLALGVNAPARTCVFAGDSIHLTPLQYRQAAGRAGRRGFDTLGEVVFVGVSLDRIQRLFLSRLPKLGGTFPLSATLVLRLHNLLHGSDNAPLPKDAIESMLSLPQLSVGNETGREQTKAFVRSTIEYLRRAGLLDDEGRPMNLYGLVSNLNPFEPSNFAFVALLRSGELHRITRNFDADPDGVIRELLIVFANLFGRQPRRARSGVKLTTQGRNNTALVILPELPERIASVLKRHDAAVVSIFSTFAKEFAQQNIKELGEDIALPLSGQRVGVSSVADGTFAANLRQSAIDFDSRSPFVALSGLGDSYNSVQELSSTCRNGLVVTTHALPVLPFITSQEHQLDAYILDFYKNGSLDSVIRDNGIPRGQVWFCLQVFDQAITQVKMSLESLLLRSNEEQEEDNDSDAGHDDPEEEGNANQITRPAHVSEADWTLYRAVVAVQTSFKEKFFAIFA